jgi:bacterioferritin (cytochrome b1)
MKNDKLARRTLLQGAATVGAAAVVTQACSPMPGGNDAGTNPDLALVNALLAAEYKAIDAYTQGAAVLQTDSSALGQPVLAVAVEFQKDHRDHAALLVKTVTALGGTPANEADNTFTLPAGFVANTTNVMKLACNEERRAAVAYNQVIKGLADKTNRYIAAAIQGDETMHYTVLAALIEGLAVPTSALTTSTADQVVPVAYASSTVTQGGSAGLESQADIATNDTM